VAGGLPSVRFDVGGVSDNVASGRDFPSRHPVACARRTDMRFFILFRALAAVGALLLTAPLMGCAGATGSFTPEGFHHAEFPVTVRYANPAAKEFLGPDWRVDNFTTEYDGTVEPKKTREYRGEESVDRRGDGNFVDSQTYYFDLKLDNRKTSAVIWMQSIHLGPNEADQNLKNLVEEYADALSGSGFYAALRWGHGLGVKAKTYAAKIVDGKETTLGGVNAYDAKLELANVDQIRIDPNARAAIIRVVLVGTQYMHPWDDYGGKARTILRVGYRASPSDFDAGLPDFERFLKLIDLGAPPVPAPPSAPKRSDGTEGAR
jgi:hypothetical protein